MTFSGKVIIITGASSGIGAATAITFAKQGASLALVARTISNLNKTKNDCIEHASVGTPVPLLIQADITKESDIERIVKETIAKFGRIDVLVNNAGVNKYHTIENVSLDDFDFVMNTNLRAVYHLTKLIIPHVEKTHGNIVNVSSVLGTRPYPSANTYCASKAALDQFTRCSAVELGTKKIRVNTVSPGLVISNFQKASGMDDCAYKKMMETAGEGYPLGRVANPDDIAEAICFLASEKARYITGVILPVDGGRSCTFR